MTLSVVAPPAASADDSVPLSTPAGDETCGRVSVSPSVTGNGTFDVTFVIDEVVYEDPNVSELCALGGACFASLTGPGIEMPVDLLATTPIVGSGSMATTTMTITEIIGDGEYQISYLCRGSTIVYQGTQRILVSTPPTTVPPTTTAPTAVPETTVPQTTASSTTPVASPVTIAEAALPATGSSSLIGMLAVALIGLGIVLRQTLRPHPQSNFDHKVA